MNAVNSVWYELSLLAERRTIFKLSAVENCIEISTGQWLDITCENSQQYVNYTQQFGNWAPIQYKDVLPE